MGGQPHYSPTKNAGPSAEWDQNSGDYQNEISSPVGRQHDDMTTTGIRVGNPSTMDEGYSENLGIQPNF